MASCSTSTNKRKFSNTEIDNETKKKKDNDVEILQQIIQSTNDYKPNQSNIRDTLIIIGGLFGKISYKDSDRINFSIRNRYGYIQRNRSKSINVNGIYFELLRHLKTVLNHQQIPEINDLGNYFPSLRGGIEHILLDCNEKFVKNIDIKSVKDISHLSEFSRRYFEPMLLDRIISEIVEFQKLGITNLRDEINFYCCAREFILIGELCCEYTEDKNDKKEKPNVVKSLKCLIQLRHQFVHNYENLQEEFKNETQLMIKMMDEIVLVFKETKCYVNQPGVDISHHSVKTFNLLNIEFMMNLILKSNNQTKQINGLILEAHSLFEDKGSNDFDVKLRNIQIKYEDELKELKEEDTDYKQSCPSDLNEGSVQKFIKSLYKIPVDSRSKDVIISQKLQQIKVFADSLIKYDQLEFEDDIMITKVKYARQYAAATIGQSVRDIVSKKDHIPEGSYFKNMCSSVLIKEGIETSMFMRNDGLVHNIWDFDEDNFQDGLNFFMAITPRFTSHYNVIMKDKLIETNPRSGDVFFLIGTSFYRLSLYDEAISYLNRAVVYFREHPDEAKLTHYKNNEVENIFRMDPIVFLTHIYLLSSYVESKKSQEVSVTGRFLIDKVCFGEISSTSISAITDVYIILNMMLTVPDNMDYCKEANDKLINLAMKINDDELTFHRARYRGWTENHKVAKELYKSIFTKKDCKIEIKYHALIIYVELSLDPKIDTIDKKELEEISAFIDEVEKVFKENRCTFIGYHSDWYFLAQNGLIRFKLQLIKRTVEKFDESVYGKLKKMSKQYKKILDKSPQSFPFISFNCQYFNNFFTEVAKCYPQFRSEIESELKDHVNLIRKYLHYLPEELQPKMLEYVRGLGGALGISQNTSL